MSHAPFNADDLNQMYRYCHSLTGDQTTAYDLLQDGLERYLRTDHGEVDTPMALLRRILRNRFIDTRRTDKSSAQDSLEVLDQQAVDIGFSTLENIVVAEEDVSRIWEMLDAQERELLHLWALEGFTAQEVADQLGQPRGTVLSRIHRLRKRLERWRDQEVEALAQASGEVML